MNQRDDRRAPYPTRCHERPRVDLVDDDVESARRLFVPEATGFAIDAKPASSAHQLDAAHGLLLRPPGNRRGEQRDVVAPLHELTGDLLRVDLGSPCEGVSGVFPVEDQDAQGTSAREGLIPIESPDRSCSKARVR
jgi:hypothetical protein